MSVHSSIDDLTQCLKGVDSTAPWSGNEFDDDRRWSYGDVENNGVYYHPQLTHYAHQVFENVFLEERGIHYADLSGKERRHRDARLGHAPPIEHRMTFPVGFLHQWMLRPMFAGDVFRTWIDAIDLAPQRIGLRAWLYGEDLSLAALVIWIRWAKDLESGELVAVPDWFPRRK